MTMSSEYDSNVSAHNQPLFAIRADPGPETVLTELEPSTPDIHRRPPLSFDSLMQAERQLLLTDPLIQAQVRNFAVLSVLSPGEFAKAAASVYTQAERQYGNGGHLDPQVVADAITALVVSGVVDADKEALRVVYEQQRNYMEEMGRQNAQLGREATRLRNELDGTTVRVNRQEVSVRATEMKLDDIIALIEKDAPGLLLQAQSIKQADYRQAAAIGALPTRVDRARAESRESGRDIEKATTLPRKVIAFSKEALTRAGLLRPRQEPVVDGAELQQAS